MIIGAQQPGNADQFGVIVGQARDAGGNDPVKLAAGRVLTARIRQVRRQPPPGRGCI
jgi:hypothetical protein